MSLYATVIRRKRCVHTTYTSLHNYSLGGAIFISLNKYFLVKKKYLFCEIVDESVLVSEMLLITLNAESTAEKMLPTFIGKLFVFD